MINRVLSLATQSEEANLSEYSGQGSSYSLPARRCSLWLVACVREGVHAEFVLISTEIEERDA